MGQSTSLNISSEDNSDLQQHKKHSSQSNKPRKICSVTHKEVANCIQELNAVTSGFTDRTGKEMRFIIRKGTDNSIFWKRTIKIYCQKLCISTKVIETSRQLSLRQFLRLHQEIIGQISALSKKYENFLTNKNSKQEKKTSHGNSLKPFNATPKKNELSVQTKECCVCKERKGCLMLSCNHEFCDICIDSWIRDEEHSNCPLCRTLESGADETLVLKDKPDVKNYKSEVKEYLMRLADRATSLGY